ncbi:MAG: DNA alkylation repair protein [Lachnospiraceae bacterium]|nr:DNA alkylation repair protein [Lachnospiraceae bacterium]
MELQQKDIKKRLFDLQDIEYKEFQTKLMPTVEGDRVIGVRTPDLRRLAKELKGTEEAEAFLRDLPHLYYEENNLHGFLLEYIKDYDACVQAVDAFLPYVDNWATCDTMSPKVFKKHLPELLEQIRVWMASEHTYTVRYGIGMLMRYYLEDAFRPEYLQWVSEVQSDEYYINMMVAWYFATALAKQYDAAILYVQEKRLPLWIHNKTIQKACESYRIDDSRKAYLRSLRLKQQKDSAK